jgi:transposase
MDRAYEGDETRQLALDLGYIPVVPPKANRLNPWEYDRAMYRKRNEVERLFRRLKGFRRVFSRFDKLDVMFILKTSVTRFPAHNFRETDASEAPGRLRERA